MTLRKATLFILILTLGFVSCKKDDDGGTVDVIIRDRTEQQLADNDSINKYLNNHYYNSSEFEALTNPSIEELVITKLLENETVPVGSTLLIDAIETKTVVFSDTDYEIHFLDLNKNVSENAPSPSFADNVLVTYEGFTLENVVFDSAINPVLFDLTSLIPGWRKVLPEFKTSESVEEAINVDSNGDGIPDISDGTLNYNNHGVGVMFLPSGLAYYSSATSGISVYSPIIFKFDLLKTSENDHDGDGVPSYLEDLNNDSEFIVNFDDLTDETDDDTDGDGTPDYFDIDDDGDGVLTINEDLNGDGDPTNDIGSNGIANYLDPEETVSKND